MVGKLAPRRIIGLFTADGSFVIEHRGVACHGLPAISEFMRATRHPLAHYGTNLVVDVDPGGERATARSKVWAPRSDGTAYVGGYRDELVRSPDGWRIRHRAVLLAADRWRPADPVIQGPSTLLEQRGGTLDHGVSGRR